MYSFFFFGTCVRYIQDVNTTYKIHGKGCLLENINACLSRLDSLGLYVTKNASQELASFKAELDEITDEDAKLSGAQCTKLNTITIQLRNTLEAELLGREAFVVTPKRFETSKLLYDIGSLMTPGVFSSLPDFTQYDLMEAGKCIAFERPTAAAFHLLRGTEAELRLFYCTLIFRSRVSPLLWGEMTKDLRNRQKTKKHTTLYNNLDNIRLSYRNPTQHPDAVYDIHEVQDLCPLCFETISRMAKILNP